MNRNELPAGTGQDPSSSPSEQPLDDHGNDASSKGAGSGGGAPHTPFGFGAGLDAGGATADPPRGKKRTRRAKRTKAVRSERGTAESAPDAESATDSPGDPPGAQQGKKKRKRSRKKRKSATTTTADAADEAPRSAASTAEPEQTGEDDSADAAKKRRRRGSRGGRRRKKSAGGAVPVEAIPGEDDDLPGGQDDASEEGAAGGAKKKRRRSRRKKSGTTGEAAEREAPARKKATRAKRSSTKTAAAAATVERDENILINAIDPEEQRVAVVDDEGRIVDLLMNSESQKNLVNDIYRGRVVNLEPAIGAAFVDFGQGRNGFLHTSDVLEIYGEKDFTLDKLLTASIHEDPDSDLDVDDVDEAESDSKKGGGRRSKRGRPQRRSRRRLPISDLLRVGDPVVVQVTKDAIGDKGPTLTTYISIPGRYLVLMPSMDRTGVSRKIPDDKERRRLKRILASLSKPEDMGVIVRTAGVGKTKTDLQRDLDYLMGMWGTFGKRLKSGRGPAPLYQESDVASRTLRDLFTARTETVWVDDPVVHEALIEFAEKQMPEQVERIKLHDNERPIFQAHGVEQDFEKIFSRRVELPSGGSIVFDSAEALVAIDVNSGRTRTDSFDFEEIAAKTNLEAVPEIARQIRLRDLGGILVCDFIDMMKSSSNRAVERAFRTELAKDRARSKIGRISQFGLLEMTRQRLGPGTHKKVFASCPRCRGTGRVRSIESRAQALLRRLGWALTLKGFTTIEVRSRPEVIDYLKEDLYDYVRALEHRFEKELQFTPVPDQQEDGVLRYLRADGREVRPGGRRKR